MRSCAGQLCNAPAEPLRTILAPLDVYLLGQPEGYIVYTPGLIDDAGTVTDGAVRAFLQQYIDQFAAWVARA